MACYSVAVSLLEGEDSENSNWCVTRKLSEFQALYRKLTEVPVLTWGHLITWHMLVSFREHLILTSVSASESTVTLCHVPDWVAMATRWVIGLLHVLRCDTNYAWQNSNATGHPPLFLSLSLASVFPLWRRSSCRHSVNCRSSPLTKNFLRSPKTNWTHFCRWAIILPCTADCICNNYSSYKHTSDCFFILEAEPKQFQLPR